MCVRAFALFCYYYVFFCLDVVSWRPALFERRGKGVAPVKKEVRGNQERQRTGERGTCGEDILYERIIYERKRNPASSRDFLRLVDCLLPEY